MTRKECKQEAMYKIQKHHWWNVLMCLALGAFKCYMPWAFSVPLDYGYYRYFKLVNEDLNPSFDDGFEAFRKVNILKQVFASIIKSIFLNLAALLFVIPAIVLDLSFTLIPLLMSENEDLGIFEAISLSNTLMKGHKMELFKFELSFVGWRLLDLLTFGLLGILWLNPFYKSAKTAFIDNKIHKINIK